AMSAHTHPAPAAALRDQLDLLLQERQIAQLEGLADPAYEAHLDDEIIATRSAYVGAAVTEIASLRAQMSGALQG
ncbi:MAG: hypothetical protein JHC95_19555, partial [Solirubrobacteraceae bacterium]|nr:hypothetical protein [Solirubrobacteraceae bacterium]